ncbi:MAG: hypothetical protein AAF919_18370 [Pseudomonadota bacterium]
MIRTASFAAILATAAGPAFADATAAIAHFNQSLESGDRIVLTDAVASSRTNAQSGIFAQFNADADGQDDLRGLNGATLVSGAPAVGGDIFAAIRAEGLENE